MRGPLLAGAGSVALSLAAIVNGARTDPATALYSGTTLGFSLMGALLSSAGPATPWAG